MYTITTFVAGDIPTRYEKPLGGGAAVAVGTETVAEYQTYDECKSQLESYSELMADKKALRLKKAKRLDIKLSATLWTSHKMYDLARQPGLLHYIDNNYPGISLPSNNGEKI